MLLPTKVVQKDFRLRPSSTRKTAPLSPGFVPSTVVTRAALPKLVHPSEAKMKMALDEIVEMERKEAGETVVKQEVDMEESSERGENMNKSKKKTIHFFRAARAFFQTGEPLDLCTGAVF